MKLRNIFRIFIIVGLIYFSQNLFAGEDNCYKCHKDIADNPSKMFSNDVHFMRGFSCSVCHGGDNTTDDMDKAMDRRKGFIGVPSGDKVSQICSKCHSDEKFMRKYSQSISIGQLEKLKTSVHGKMGLNGKEMIVECITCHNAHGIKHVKDSSSPVSPINVPATCNKCHGNIQFIQKYNPKLSVDQLTKYRTSVHGMLNAKGNSKVAECSSCHGSHQILAASDSRSQVNKMNIPNTCGKCHSNVEYMKQFKIPTNQLENYKQSVHGKALFVKKDMSAPVCNDCHGNHAATPPGITSISKVCGTCHALNSDLFSGSPHKKAFDEKGYPECETCHGNHLIVHPTDNLLGGKQPAICSKCHSQESNTKGYYTAIKMRNYLDSLVALDSLANKLILEAEQKGMDVEELKFKVREIHQAEMEARTIIHAFNEGKFQEVTNKGFASSQIIIEDANGKVHDFFFRRYGLVVSILVVSLLIFLLYLYIRKLESKK